MLARTWRTLRERWLAAALPIFCILVQPGAAEAARSIDVCPRGCDYTTIQTAVDDALPGDTIRVAPGVYKEHLSLYDRRITITGAGAAKTIVSGDNEGRVLLLYANSTLTLSNITLRGGKVADNQGGGIYNDGVLIVNDAHIVDNRASVAGGGIANFGTLVLNDSLVVENSAYMGNGGGIVNGGRLYVMDSTIKDNNASARGGGIYHSVGTFTLLRSKVVNNRAAAGGGGVANFDFMSTADTQITANTTDGAGGGILNGGHLTAVNTTFSGNRADDGNSLYNSGTLVFGSIESAASGDGVDCTNMGLMVPLLPGSDGDTPCGPLQPDG
jgi:hypothetical protein